MKTLGKLKQKYLQTLVKTTYINTLDGKAQQMQVQKFDISSKKGWYQIHVFSWISENQM